MVKRDKFPPVGHLAVSGDISGCHLVVREMLLASTVKVQDVAKHPAMHRTAPTTKDYQAQNVNSAEKPWFRV